MQTMRPKPTRNAELPMVRTSIFLPRHLRARILIAARGLAVKKSEVVRRATQEYFERTDAKKHRSLFPIENMEQLVDSGLLGDITLAELQERIRAFHRSRSKSGRRRR